MKMPSPSSAVLRNRADIYRAVSSQDADGAPQFTYGDVPDILNAACSVQYTDTGQDPDPLKRLTQVNLYDVMFAANPRLKPRDKIVWRDPVPARILFVETCPPGEAGRDSAFVVRALEKL